MAKVDIDIVKQILQRSDIDSLKIKEILDDLDRELKVVQEEKEIKEPPVKKQFIFVLNDPEGKFKQDEFSGWVLQMPEDDSVYGVLDSLYQSAYDFNVSAKGRRYPVRKVSELIEFCPAKIFKEHKLWTKHKEPVAVITTNNIIPTE